MYTYILINIHLLSTEPASLMTKYYLKFDTMKHIMKAPLNCSIEDALHIVCRAEEISCMYLGNCFYLMNLSSWS